MAIRIQTIDGQAIDLDESEIVLFAGPYPHDVGVHTYIYTASYKLYVTGERVDRFANRLPNIKSFAELTRPNLTPVEVRGSAVTRLRDALPTETPAKTVALVGKLHQAVMEDLPTVTQLINSHGGSV